MHIVYVSGTYMPAAGGAEISMFSLLRSFAARGIGVSVFKSIRVSASRRFSQDVGIRVNHVDTARLTDVLIDFCRHNEVDLIITQNLWAELAIDVSSVLHIPSIYFARTAHGDLDLSYGGRNECTAIISNSNYVAEFIKNRWGRRSHIVRSIISLEEYRADGGVRSYITMVNPVGHKGGAIFRAVVAALPNYKFLAVQGWSHLRKGERWDRDQFQELALGFGSSELWVPEDIDLTNMSNLTWKNGTDDMREVYSVTRLLLVPSIYAESVPRVVLEAMVNGIPVIGSDLGGITEALCSTGVLVSNYRSPQAWVEAVLSLDDPDLYSRISTASTRYVASLDYISEVERCISIFREVIRNWIR